MTITKITGIAFIFVLGVLLVVGFVSHDGPAVEPTPTATPTPLPTVTMSCVQARDTIQQALDAYNDKHGEWPTADGQPGDIEWTKLVPDFIAAIPRNDSKCEWWVNSDPEGAVCLQNIC